jgi:hypothetical protein
MLEELQVQGQVHYLSVVEAEALVDQGVVVCQDQELED